MNSTQGSSAKRKIEETLAARIASGELPGYLYGDEDEDEDSEGSGKGGGEGSQEHSDPENQRQSS